VCPELVAQPLQMAPQDGQCSLGFLHRCKKYSTVCEGYNIVALLHIRFDTSVHPVDVGSGSEIGRFIPRCIELVQRGNASVASIQRHFVAFSRQRGAAAA
jgi:hypothetical protein